ncbi:triple tyrosine motif-containing protein [Lutimonas sp.]|uniref:triple tyrosine motif-containing protein n=1 Tax=Lutimonas sp. TaxID=1872403 RepID=UPI003D9B6D44
MRCILITIYLFLVHLGLTGQELPPVQNYGTIDYNAGNQNWSITQDASKHLYFGNNNGLLEFNGSLWTLYPSPNGTIIRAVYEKDGLIYSGCFMEFGFWQRDQFGDLIYTSLIDKLSVPLIEDEHVWNITSRDKWILFQTLDRLYIYHTEEKTFKIVDFEVSRAKIFNLKDKLFLQKGDGGLYSIQNGKPVLESSDKILLNNFIVGLYHDKDRLLLLTERGDFYHFDEGVLTAWEVEALKNETDLTLYSSQKLSDGGFVLGTISKGYIRLDKDGKPLERMNQENGLVNNTVLTVFQDVDDNLWLGLDNGISTINLESAFKVYTDSKGKFGSVYTSLEHQGILYLGTNQGLFARELGSSQDFRLLKGTSGQVWNLSSVSDVLICSHNEGTFIIDGFNARHIYAGSGTWEVKTVPEHNDLLLQGNYDGFSVLEKSNGRWTFKGKIEGFEISSKSFEFAGPEKVLMNHEYSGVHIIDMDPTFTSVKKVANLEPKGVDSQVFKFRNRILYSSSEGVFNFDKKTLEMQKDSLLTAVFYNPMDPISGKLITDKKNNRLWGFSANNLIYLSPDTFDGSPKKMQLPIPTFFRRNQGVLGYESISLLSDGNYVIGSSNGYSILDLKKSHEKEYRITINSFLQKFLHKDNEKLDLSQELTFNYDENNLICYYGIPEYDNYAEVKYQYRLIGFDDEWSKWYSEPFISLENLPFGTYSLRIRGRVGNSLTENTASLDFKVSRPWYLSITAIVSYVLLFLTAMLVINRLFVVYYRRQRTKLIEDNNKQLEFNRLESEQEIMKIKNDQLRIELESKNRELATTAMSMINKNELLQGIKNDLLQLENSASRKEVAKVIDQNLSNNNDWEFFKEAFNNADKDFLHKIKKLHPSLTANDLKFCAFLRLNLSSKEIAPLLNISVRSVEIKRYRLRKKMNLEHSENLIEYILAI